MSIQRRLAISITLVLLLSLVLGSALTYWHVVAKVGTEMEAALAVGTQTAVKAVDGRDGPADDDPARHLRRVVAEFNGDRHLAAVLRGSDGRTLAQSALSQPEDPAPAWFYDLVAGAPTGTDLPVPQTLQGVGSLRLEADPHNEVAEAWSDLVLTVSIMAMFFSLVLALTFWTIRDALRPLRDLRAALSRIGAGDYTTRMTPSHYRDLEPLRAGFDAMAERLDAMRSQNQDLHEQILSLQEEERAELARDLHDDVAPFLFSVGADAAMIRQYVGAGAMDQVGPRAEAIAESVRHMQKHVKHVLRRLAPETLIDLGLAGAIDNLAAFWKLRRPRVVFALDITEEPIDPPLDAVAFRVVQESISNAIRHGDPSAIHVRIGVTEGTLTVRVEDDGSGLAAGRTPTGFGLAGMRDRVRTVGGQLTIRNRDPRGVSVVATVPIRVEQDEPLSMDMDA